MNDPNPPRPIAPWSHRALWVAAVLALAAAAQIALERWSVGTPVPHLFRGRVLPALLWVAAVPLIMRLGDRFPVRGDQAIRDVAVHAAALAAWLFATNLLLRLPDAGRLGWSWVIDDTRAGMVRYTPTAVLLWSVLAWLGRGARPATGGEEGVAEARPEPGDPPEATVTDDAATGLATLALPGLNRVRLVPIEQIRYLEADGDHVRVHTTEGPHRVRARLTDLERRLAASRTFVRIHRSHLVNLGHLREVQPFQHGDWVAVMSDGAELRIPRTRRRALERILGKGAEA